LPSTCNSDWSTSSWHLDHVITRTTITVFSLVQMLVQSYVRRWFLSYIAMVISIWIGYIVCNLTTVWFHVTLSTSTVFLLKNYSFKLAVGERPVTRSVSVCDRVSFLHQCMYMYIVFIGWCQVTGNKGPHSAPCSTQNRL